MHPTTSLDPAGCSRPRAPHILLLGLALPVVLAGWTAPAQEVGHRGNVEPGALRTATGCLQPGKEPDTFLLGGVKWVAPEHRDGKDTAGGHHQGAEREAPGPRAAGRTQGNEPGAVRLAGPLERLKVREHLGFTVTATGMLAADDTAVEPAIVLPDRPDAGAGTARAAPGPRPVFNIHSLTRVRKGCG